LECVPAAAAYKQVDMAYMCGKRPTTGTGKENGPPKVINHATTFTRSLRLLGSLEKAIHEGRQSIIKGQHKRDEDHGHLFCKKAKESIKSVEFNSSKARPAFPFVSLYVKCCIHIICLRTKLKHFHHKGLVKRIPLNTLPSVPWNKYFVTFKSTAFSFYMSRYSFSFGIIIFCYGRILLDCNIKKRNNR
jgi:hypothetical protein